MNDITTKQAIDTRAALRWLLGAAMIGGGLRAGVSLAHNIGSVPDVKLRDSHDLYDPEIEMPVDMTPEQLKRYQELSAPAQKVAEGAWDNTFNMISGVAGGVAGWHLMHALIKRRKKQQLDQQLDDVRTELAQLTGNAPTLVDPLDPKAAKTAAAWDFLDIAAQRYVRHYKNSRENRVYVAGLRKTAGILDILKSVGAKANNLDPLTKLLIGGGAAAAATPLIPGVSRAIEGAGKGVTGTITGAGKAVLRPVGYGLAAALGPVAALSLLYGVNRGFQTARDRDKRIADLKALREAIREQEIKEQPYFKLTPRLNREAQKAKNLEAAQAAEAAQAPASPAPIKEAA
jgi:hypothetical protein